ncbi:hypothetical protein SpCBS45565_g05347 [Spizellomyces sp. 'palustris']|nr:hypothetical protein SpCBS45565_g05347 [Spizellomyces sp. 'palustris']
MSVAGTYQTLSSVQRAVRTAWSDLKYHRTSWQDLSDDGTGVANKLLNLVLKKKYARESTAWAPGLSEFEGVTEEYEKKLEVELKAPVYELNEIIVRLTQLLKKMQILYLHLESLLDDTSNNIGERYAYETPLFRSQTLEGHVGLFRKTIDMYATELSLKRRIAESLPTLRDRREAMFHLTAWLQEPYLDLEVLQEIDDIWELESSVEGGS